MNKFSKFVSSQFRNPQGICGKMISLIQNIVNTKMYNSTVSFVNLEKNEKVLDIGYGNGHLLKYIYTK